MNGLHGAFCVWIPELLTWHITKVATHGSLVDVVSSAVDWQVVRGDQKIYFTTQCRLYSNDRNVVTASGPNSVDSDVRTKFFGQCTNKLAEDATRLEFPMSVFFELRLSPTWCSVLRFPRFVQSSEPVESGGEDHGGTP